MKHKTWSMRCEAWLELCVVGHATSAGALDGVWFVLQQWFMRHLCLRRADADGRLFGIRKGVGAVEL